MTNGGYRRKRPIGLFIFGWVLIISSLAHMRIFIFSHEIYWTIFNYLPDWAVTLRYCGSWLQRILGISAGIGLLTGSKVCRKIAIGLAIYTLITLYWKHDLQALMNYCQIFLDHYGRVFAPLHGQGWTIVRLSKLIMIILIGLDVLFFTSLLFYLNRPLVKEYFQRSPG